LHIGDAFFVTLKVLPDPSNPSNLVATNIGASSEGLAGNPEGNYESHNWKFYELRPTGFPYTADTAHTEHGWFARGDFNINIWYTITATSNTPPDYPEVDQLNNTFITGPRPINAVITDCNFADSTHAGVQNAEIVYYTNTQPAPQTAPMTSLDNTNYSGNIPGFSAGTTVFWHLQATDIDGLSSISPSRSYEVMAFRNAYTYPETTSTYTPSPIHGVGTRIDSSHFFLAIGPDSSSNANPKDDGTAGPFGPFNFMFFGDTMHYAWVGVNGVMTLSKSATDTVDANFGDFFSNVSIPFSQEKVHRDTGLGGTYGRGPRNFIAPFSNDLIYTTGGHYLGDIWTKQTASTFTVEWDSVGQFATNGTGTKGTEVVRAILDFNAATIEYQYDNVGLEGLDTTATVGLESDSSDANEGHGYSYLVHIGYPAEVRPQNGFSIKYLPMVYVNAANGWNMVSVGNTPVGSNYAKSALYPTATTNAFNYHNGYHPQTTMANGPGYWLKFPSAQTVATAGTFLTSVDDSITNSWNMIGSLSGAVDVSTISTTPTGLVTNASIYYGYNAGYQSTSFLKPGQAYWVKSSGAGIMHLHTSANAPKTVATEATDDLTKLTTITVRSSGRGAGMQNLYFADQSQIHQSYELPPVPPEGAFDARFSSQTMVATYPTTFANGQAYEYPIEIQATGYPVTISWHIANSLGTRKYVLTDAMGGRVLGNNVMNGNGSLKISNASIKTVVVKMLEGVNTPKAFALSQNYPNPFNPTTRMTVDVPKSSTVEVSVFDILGQKIATLMNGQQPAGSFTIEWNGQDAKGLQVPTGMYFVRMTSDAFSSVRKIMLMK
ncbi:MAG TPA: FlgD immunoglobulin-like domain containing protein, partial [Bacteroidota bacterium]|nr:FlgD immunoglobulin-like domain containing protein [Bacteroidota bacterium]